MNKQKVIYNKIIPFKGFTAINLFGILFVRKGVVINDRLLQHEYIHTLQQKELLYIGFYILYIVFWFANLFKYGISINAYKNIPFEKEAYSLQNEKELKRSLYNWTKYL